MTEPLCSFLGVPNEDNAREESRKKSREYCQRPGSPMRKVLATGIRKLKEPCDQLEGVYAPEFGLSLRSFPLWDST
jgi:hypothetical protein